MEAILTKVETRMGEPVFTIAPNAAGVARDAAEIAAATFLLHDACPLLEQLPAKRVTQLREMASEKHRKEIAA